MDDETLHHILLVCPALSEECKTLCGAYKLGLATSCQENFPWAPSSVASHAFVALLDFLECGDSIARL
ncbi:hypothetical protein HPB50_008559 [Hyalomma asiaticum]|uniref:Uncharacterized protein n=1 Tax=Hyalomma asiaticum TaxID=266040 RepID=A0ACB7RVI9_HYAAI|nr:hypothetical protein HPB50_008559 [Hyalomma asiaticum]